MPENLLFYFAHTSVWNLGSICVCSRLVCCYYSWEGADRSLLAQVWDSVWTTLGICENTLKSKVFCLQHYLNTSFDRDRILLDVENYSEFLLTNNDVPLILWNGEKLHGEVLVWSSRQCNKVFFPIYQKNFIPTGNIVSHQPWIHANVKVQHHKVVISLAESLNFQRRLNCLGKEKMEWRQEKLLDGIQFAFQSAYFIIMFWFNQIHYLYFIFP